MQGNRFILTATGILAGFFLTTSAFAVMSTPYGWYLEANFGSTKVSDINYPGSVSTSGLGGNVNLAYKFMPYFAMELGYSQYTNSTIKDHFGNKAANIKHFSYDLAGKGIVPVSDSGFEIIAKLGVQRNNAHVSLTNQQAAQNIGISSSDHSNTGLYMGVGAQYYFMPEFAAIIQWQRAQGNSSTGTADLYTVGVSYIFD